MPVLRAAAAALLAVTVVDVCETATPQTRDTSTRVLPRVDEGARDLSWIAFRDRLLTAVRARDRAYVVNVLDPDVANSISQENPGIANFQRQWKLDADPDRSPLWSVIETVLTLGGTFIRPDTFCAPYVYTRFPRGLSPFDHGVVVRANAPVFARPTTSSPVVTSLSFEIVRTEPLPAPERFEQPGWILVHASNGQSGYMQKVDVRSPLDYRACFTKRDGVWKMALLVAGD